MDKITWTFMLLWPWYFLFVLFIDISCFLLQTLAKLATLNCPLYLCHPGPCYSPSRPLLQSIPALVTVHTGPCYSPSRPLLQSIPRYVCVFYCYMSWNYQHVLSITISPLLLYYVGALFIMCVKNILVSSYNNCTRSVSK